MLYLAEVQRKTRVIGGGKAEFRLLACQRGENSWSAVPGEEVVAAPDDANYSAGALVMLELTSSRQIQRHSEAGRQLVSILQNFTRLQEKAKTQEEEIEQWKQSLTYQSQELNRREMEMEARQEQLQQMEEDFERLEQQRQEIDAAREEMERLKEEFERKNEELSGAWAHLRGEMNRLEERQAEMQGAAVLDEQNSHQMQELLNRLSSVVMPTETVREQLNLSFEVISQQQSVFDQFWQTLDQQRGSAHQLQEEVDRQAQDVQNRWQEWHFAQNNLEQAKADLKAQQSELGLKQEYVQRVSTQLKQQETLYKQVLELAESSDTVKLGAKVDIEALERMPLDELQTVVSELEKDLEKLSRFVSSQEEELTLQQKAIEDLQTQLGHVSEFDRLQLEAELAGERENYEMLNETLVGQRRNLQEREEVLKKHQGVLARRQGLATSEPVEPEIDLGPVLTKIEESKQRYVQELRELEEQVQALRASVDQLQATVNAQATAQETKRNDLKQFEQQWNSQRTAVAELWGKVNTYQETLQPSQDSVNSLRQKLEAIVDVMAHFQEASDYQLQAIAEMRQMIMSMSGNQSPEFVVS